MIPRPTYFRTMWLVLLRCDTHLWYSYYFLLCLCSGRMRSKHRTTLQGMTAAFTALSGTYWLWCHNSCEATVLYIAAPTKGPGKLQQLVKTCLFSRQWPFILWPYGITRCSFVGTLCSHLHFLPKDGGRRFLWNVVLEKFRLTHLPMPFQLQTSKCNSDHKWRGIWEQVVVDHFKMLLTAYSIHLERLW